MGFFDKLFRKEDPSDALVRHTGAVFSSCVEISQNFFKKESNSILEYISKNDIPASDFNKFVKHGVFEILLLNTVFVQRSGALYVGIRTALFKNTLTVHLHAYCKANGITDDLPCTYSDFVLNRYDFYGDIVEALLLAKDDYRYDDVVHSDLASVFLNLLCL